MRRFPGSKLTIILVTGCLFSLSVLILMGLYSVKFGQCIRFPNGTEIGYEANIDFGNPYFSPDAVLRDPQGKIIAKDVSPIHITENATFGWAWHETENGREGFRFIWTRESGIVREDRNPDIYRRLERDSGDTYDGIPQNKNINTTWLLINLMKDPRFKSNRCKTSLLTF